MERVNSESFNKLVFLFLKDCLVMLNNHLLNFN